MSETVYRIEAPGLMVGSDGWGNELRAAAEHLRTLTAPVSVAGSSD